MPISPGRCNLHVSRWRLLVETVQRGELQDAKNSKFELHLFFTFYPLQQLLEFQMPWYQVIDIESQSDIQNQDTRNFDSNPTTQLFLCGVLYEGNNKIFKKLRFGDLLQQPLQLTFGREPQQFLLIVHISWRRGSLNNLQ